MASPVRAHTQRVEGVCLLTFLATCAKAYLSGGAQNVIHRERQPFANLDVQCRYSCVSSSFFSRYIALSQSTSVYRRAQYAATFFELSFWTRLR